MQPTKSEAAGRTGGLLGSPRAGAWGRTAGVTRTPVAYDNKLLGAFEQAQTPGSGHLTLALPGIRIACCGGQGSPGLPSHRARAGCKSLCPHGYRTA